MTRFDIETFRSTAKAAVEAEGLRPFARRTGIALGVIRSVLDSRDPGISNVLSLSDALGLSLALGDGIETRAQQLLVDGNDYTRIPVLDAQLSAGPGVENGDVAIIDHLVFRHEWLRKISVKSDDAMMARVSGDSMAPGIQNGDLVMIDKTLREVPVRRKARPPQRLPIFAFMQDQEARVKRLERLPKEKVLILYSDNRDIAPEVIAEADAHTLNILGQVVWSGHVWR